MIARSRIALAALAAAACVAGGVTREQPSAPQQLRARAELALRAGRVLDPVTGRYNESAVILVRNGRISDVIPAREYRADLADSVIDLSQLTVLPGLIDGHVHLAIGGTVASNALADLRAGFTTVVDLGARTHRLLQLRDSINAGHLPGPRVLAAGIWVGTTGGVCEFNGIGIAGGPEEFRARIRSNAAAGAEIAKLCLSGWPGQAFAEPASYELPDDVIRASVAEARAQGLVTVAHAISLGSVRAALDAGVDGLAHAAYLDSGAAVRMRDQGVFMVSTLATLTSGDTSIGARSLIGALSLAARNGVAIVFGTDGGVLPHGRNAEELRALVDAGLSPLEAIRAATVNAARAFRIQDSIGMIEPGKVADLIAVAGDPIADIVTLERPVLVVSRGRIVRDDRARFPGGAAGASGLAAQTPDTAAVEPVAVSRSYREILQQRRNASRDSLLQELDAARGRWRSQRARSFRYRVEIRCACIRIPRPPAYTIVEVSGDSVLSVRDSTGAAANPFYPVDGQQSPRWLFAIAEAAIRDSADRVDVIFDDVSGLPLLVRTDEQFNRTDDELEVRVTHLEPLP